MILNLSVVLILNTMDLDYLFFFSDRILSCNLKMDKNGKSINGKEKVKVSGKKIDYRKIRITYIDSDVIDSSSE